MGTEVETPAASEELVVVGVAPEVEWSREECESAREAAVAMEWASRERRETGGEESSGMVSGSASLALDFSAAFSDLADFLVSLRLKRRVVNEGAAGLSFGVMDR